LGVATGFFALFLNETLGLREYELPFMGERNNQMYAQATHIQFDPDMTDEAISIIRDIILPNAKKQKGFKGALLLRDVDTDKSLVITLWTTVEDLMASSPPEVIQADLDRLEELTSGTPTQEIYGVLLHL